MNLVQICGVVGVMLLIIVVGVVSGRHVKNAEEFASGGGKAGYGVVAGMVMGALVGGSCTIGTAQLAYSRGLFAWWYSLSAGLGCLVLGLFYTRPYRRTDSPTLIGILRREYGESVDIAVSAVISVSWIVGVTAQLLAATAVIPFIFPGMSAMVSIVLTAMLMVVYVVFGGALSAGEVGRIKVVLIYAAVISGVYVIFKTTGIGGLGASLDRSVYFNLFAEGAGREAGKALSVILGLSTAQCYMQALRMGRSDKVSRGSMIISAVMIPLVGLGSVLIGMFMRVSSTVVENSKDVFPLFALNYLPDWLGGIVMGTLLLTIIGSGASGAMAAGITISCDIIQPLTGKFNDPKHSLYLTRVCLVLVLAGGCVLSMGGLGSLMLYFTFLSMGVMAAAMFVPMTCALLFPGRVHRRWVLISVFVGPALTILFGFWEILPLDGSLVGMLGGALCCALGVLAQKKNHV